MIPDCVKLIVKANHRDACWDISTLLSYFILFFNAQDQTQALPHASKIDAQPPPPLSFSVNLM